MLSRVEKYEIVDEIGRGGMATVYRARDTRLQREVALKVMHPHLQGAKEARQRFAREALTVAKLHHPSILEIYDYSGEDSEVAYIATELLTGPTLKQFAEQHAVIPPEVAACLVLPVAQALSVAHEAGVIHRDVKPENIMLHQARVVKLTDFGIAQLVDAQSMTTTGQVLGSPGHMAPEQIEGKDCGARTDIFSLGTVLYLLATGELPFTGKNPHQILKRIMESRYAEPLQVRSAIGAKLARIIRRCLELDPEQRYQNASELEADLVDFVGDMEIERPADLLVEYLDDPEGFTERFRRRSIDRLTELGERAQRRGSVPVALDYFNRVLALDDGNERVLASVQRLGRRSALRRSAVVASLMVGAVGAVVVVASAWGREQPPTDPTPERVSKPSETASPTPPVKPNVKPARPPTQDARPARPAEPRARKTEPRPRPTPVPKGPRRVTFRPVPANVAIGINGERPRDFGPSFRDVELEPGVHRFKFVGAHDCCIDEEVTVKIPPGAEPFTVAQRLKFRPAGLYVVTKTPANVVVDNGRVSGRSTSLIEVTDLENMEETHTIRVTAEGHAEHVQDVRLKAGQVVTVRVAMAPANTEGT